MIIYVIIDSITLHLIERVMNGDSNSIGPGAQQLQRKNNQALPKDGLLTAIVVTPVLLAVLFFFLYVSQGSVRLVLELPWFTPMSSSFVILTSLSVAFLALGRYHVRCDSISYWIGMAFAGFSVGYLFYMLTLPGLLTEGQSLFADLANTSGWMSLLTVTIPGLLLLAAAVLPWPKEQALTGRRATTSMAAWIIVVAVVFVLITIFEHKIPILVRSDGTFTLPLFTWNAILILVYLLGSTFSAWRYLKTGDRLIGFVTFFQIALVFSPLLTILAGRRYDLWWYLARVVLVGGCAVVLYGLLVEYIHLFRRVLDSEARYRQLTESLPQLIWSSDANGLYTYLSPQWVAYTGIPETDQLGNDWINQISPEDRQAAQGTWKAAQASGSPFNTEYRLRRQDGEYRWFKILGLPIRNSEGEITHWFGSCTDIHDLKRTTAVLQKYTGDLERSNRDLQEFAFVASHDLQEPLRKIEAFADLALGISDNLGENHRDLLRRMQNSASRMRAMVNGLLQLSRLETHAQPFQKIDLNGIIQEVLSDLEIQIMQTNAVVEVCDLPALEADPLQIRLLFQNLIENALKFQPLGNQPEVKICLGQIQQHSFQLLVTDNGIGFDEKHAGHLFEPFKRLVGRAEYEGSGMGLAICRKIVERHHGSITAHSQPGQGTTFTISLPLHQDQYSLLVGRTKTYWSPS